MTHVNQSETPLTLEDLRARRDGILALAIHYGVTNVRVFGSIARGEAGPGSDVDLLVDGLEFSPWGGRSLLIRLQQTLRRPVHLVSAADLHPVIRQQAISP
jgi:hypothetical protein